MGLEAQPSGSRHKRKISSHLLIHLTHVCVDHACYSFSNKYFKVLTITESTLQEDICYPGGFGYGPYQDIKVPRDTKAEEGQINSFGTQGSSK